MKSSNFKLREKSYFATVHWIPAAVYAEPDAWRESRDPQILNLPVIIEKSR